MTRTIIVGGVAGGMSTATRLRRNDESREIIVFERSGYVSFANCGLPYHLGEVIPDRGSLLLQTPEALKTRFNIDAYVNHEVISVSPATHEVVVRNLSTGEESTWEYDTLVLAPGARPRVPEIPGIERGLSLRTVEDLDRIKAQVDGLVAGQGTSAPSAVVIGGGFIGVEVAENLAHRGLSVTLVEAAPQIMVQLDPEMAIRVLQTLEANGVRVLTNAKISAIHPETIEVERGSQKETLPADLVITAIGVVPDSHLAETAGLTRDARGFIVVNASCRTSDPDIYALGDAVAKRDFITESPIPLPLAQNANRHGRIIADILTGRDTTTKPVLGTAILGVFGTVAATTGWTETQLRSKGRPYRAIHTHPMQHAGYYPGAQSMALKLLVDPKTDAILGAQGVGGEGVDKRIDVLATAITGGITASQLADLELAYAPQFGSAKDPVALLGMIAENRAHGDKAVQWHELHTLMEVDRIPLIDVRTSGEIATEPIPGALSYTLDELRANIDTIRELATDGKVIVSCRVGQRGHTAARILSSHGIEAYNLDGGYLTWKDGHTATEYAALP
ncbi:FAD-dependent oxidoreductase [Corynebacterium freiburgense]|uniref:FAD-dependent oxidoreductase n=1 Tax=Corynebacterium freiburgense TaxID=556548 RepID=UPI0003F598AB|nr:FAD-dependent oxidoreductase [Corynebacterium freiburgense]WJZ02075.1 Coenzyme A disulfide reductase [Corynebacterium freiburgense]